MNTPSDHSLSLLVFPAHRLVASLALIGISLSFASGAFGQNLTVDADLGNSPFSVTSGTATFGNVTVGVTSSGVLNQTGGTLAVDIGGQLGIAAAGATGAYNLNGGTLAVPKVAGGGGAGTFNFNGGILQALDSVADFFQGLTTANVRDSGPERDGESLDGPCRGRFLRAGNF